MIRGGQIRTTDFGLLQLPTGLLFLIFSAKSETAFSRFNLSSVSLYLPVALIAYLPSPISGRIRKEHPENDPANAGQGRVYPSYETDFSSVESKLRKPKNSPMPFSQRAWQCWFGKQGKNGETSSGSFSSSDAVVVGLLKDADTPYSKSAAFQVCFFVIS